MACISTSSPKQDFSTKSLRVDVVPQCLILMEKVLGKYWELHHGGFDGKNIEHCRVGTGKSASRIYLVENQEIHGLVLQGPSARTNCFYHQIDRGVLKVFLEWEGTSPQSWGHTAEPGSPTIFAPISFSAWSSAHHRPRKVTPKSFPIVNAARIYHFDNITSIGMWFPHCERKSHHSKKHDFWRVKLEYCEVLFALSTPC